MASAAEQVAAFSIHEELWHEIWVAATASARSKKRSVSFEVAPRVQKFLLSYGPSTDKPLTLRVYGTMLKGFSVINNEKSKALHNDCERVVLLFNQRPLVSGDAAARGEKTPAKRQRVDAMTLDLDISKVKEGETMDWSQTPMKEDALLQLRLGTDLDTALVPLPAPEACGGQLVPLCNGIADDTGKFPELAALQAEAFPPLPAQQMEEEVAAALFGAQGGLEAFPVQESTAAGSGSRPAKGQQKRKQDELQPVEGEAQDGQLVPQSEEAPARLRPKARRLPRLPEPGHVTGFDVEPTLSERVLASWRQAGDTLTAPRASVADYASILLQQTPAPDHLGPLRFFLDPPMKMWASLLSTPAPVAIAGRQTAAEPNAAVAVQGSEVQGAGGAQQENPLLVAPPADDTAVEEPDPFRPYSPRPQARLAKGADEELAGVLAGPASVDDQAGAKMDNIDAKYDMTAAKVGSVFKRVLGKCKKASEQVCFDDMAPPSNTEKAVAARTFHALLTLATAGDFAVAQELPYGPIGISLP
eukprot:TRINITY_DN31389_c0_g1_i1.p1 TRINITY_DN31389_c0_g1~~TRINITY_DN31389_c0_g1_i1.p1  ORF type:complete len:530 (-),score=149.57 TRINITY_DN31389_c0_g1_i1:111-1700(-)